MEGNRDLRSSRSIHSGPLTALCCRLRPGDDLVASIKTLASDISNYTSAAIVLSCVGSLSSLTLRMANATPSGGSDGSQCRTWSEPLEIVSLVGTIVPQTTAFHLHMAVSDAAGCVYGGHLIHATVHTTIELTLGTMASVVFERDFDPETGYRELVVSSTSTATSESLTQLQD
jgi:uncharacterized protein